MTESVLSFKTSGGDYYALPQSKITKLKLEFPDKDVDSVLSTMRRKLEEGRYSYSKRGMLRAIKQWIPKGPPKQDGRVSAAHKLAERIQRETKEREEKEAAIPRPSAERVGEICRQLRSSLPAYERKEPERVDWLRCHHVWSTSFYGGGQWCESCGTFRDQWRAV